MDIAHEFDTRKPWVTKFLIDGSAYGGDFDAMSDVRVEQFIDRFPAAGSILELGSLEGGQSFNLAGRPSVNKVFALEGRMANIEKARFVQRLLDVPTVEFAQADLEVANLSAFGRFDAVFCSGLLYHLPKPWNLIAECASVSPNLFIWTHVAAEKDAKKLVNGYRGRWFREGSLFDPLSGLSKKSFWLSLGSLINLLTDHGYTDIHIISSDTQHPHGPSVTLAASI